MLESTGPEKSSSNPTNWVLPARLLPRLEGSAGGATSASATAGAAELLVDCVSITVAVICQLVYQ